MSEGLNHRYWSTEKYVMCSDEPSVIRIFISRFVHEKHMEMVLRVQWLCIWGHLASTVAPLLSQKKVLNYPWVVAPNGPSSVALVKEQNGAKLHPVLTPGFLFIFLL